MKISKSTIIGIFFAGMLLGYVGSLWQRAAQMKNEIRIEQDR